MRILILSPVDPSALDELRAHHDVMDAVGTPQEEIAGLIEDREIVVMRSGVELTDVEMDSAPELRLIIRAGSGVDNIDVESAKARGVRVARIPGPAAQSVAELTVGLIFAVSRKIRWADATMRAGEWRKSEMTGTLIAGKTVGVIGLGNIGTRVAQLVGALGANVQGCVERPSDFLARRLSSEGISLCDFETAISTSDVVSLHVPLNERTHHLISRRELAMMKPQSYLINTARGGVVDEAALHAVLEAGGPVVGAALDVHEHERTLSPLAGLPQVVLTPHIGSGAVETQADIGSRIVGMVSSFAASRLDEFLSDVEFVA